jgi:hypothetical protein
MFIIMACHYRYDGSLLYYVVYVIQYDFYVMLLIFTHQHSVYRKMRECVHKCIQIWASSTST